MSKIKSATTPEELDAILANLTVQASYGGRHDHLNAEHGLKFDRVVGSRAEAEAHRVLVDTDDLLAAFPGPSFALIENFNGDKG